MSPAPTLMPDIPSQTPLPPSPVVTATPAATPTVTPVPLPWTDELFTMYGICFEAALDVAGEIVVLRSADEHIAYYNRVDASGLCRRPVERAPFEFADGARVLAGTWSVGTGCTAEHEVVSWMQEDDTLRVTVRFVTEGDCNYELVRPFWIGVDDVENVEITVLEEIE
ncbi:MAG: hypothetical protein AAFV33_22170 [Chloroflexota bacterium]